MSWNDQNLQKQILEILNERYGESFSSRKIAKCIWPNQQLEFRNALSDEIAAALGVNPIIEDQVVLKLHNNIKYLGDNDYVNIEKYQSNDSTDLHIKITAKGSDSLRYDGGLTAKDNILIVKLHTDTIALLAKKINDANISPEEKSKLQIVLSKFGDSAISKITEKAIDAVPVATIIGVLNSIIS